MPSKFVQRSFSENSYYHVFNRGIDGRPIFVDPQDFRVFMFYLFVYLATPDEVLKKFPDVSLRLRQHNLNGKIKMSAYCLMPNHFHLVLFQNTTDGVSTLMKQVINGYTVYFNHKYRRTGGLFQGRFRAANITREELVLPLVRFIHNNPVLAEISTNAADYEWSSYRVYAGLAGDDGIVDKQLVNAKFGTVEDYLVWHKNRLEAAVDLERIRGLVIDG